MQQNIVDTVTLNNLSIGKTYTVSGTLMDAENETELLVNGETVTATATIEVTEDGKFVLVDGYAETLTVTSVSDGTASGTIDLVFSFDSSLLNNEATTIVVFEKLIHNGIAVTVHEDYDDEDQTVYEVEVHTSAIDDTTGTHTGSVEEKSTITDTVNMAGLVEGEEYTVTGILVDLDASSADELVYITDSNGDYITASATFTASESSTEGNFISTIGETAETVEEALEMIGDDYDAYYAVVEEGTDEVPASTYLITDDGYVLVGGDGTVYQIDDSLISEVYGYSESSATYIVEEGTDEIPAGTYTLTDEGYVLASDESGTVYDIPDDLITSATSSSTRSESIAISSGGGALSVSGTTYLTFDISDANVEGRTVTAVEMLYHNGVLIAEHALSVDENGDIEADSEQTLFYPTGKTNLTDGTTETHSAYALATQTLIDNVYFQNLIVGKEYTISGQLYNEETGEEIEGATAEITFTASEDMDECGVTDLVVTTHADGTVTVSGYILLTFTFEYEYLAGMKIVAGETFYVIEDEPIKIFAHYDLTDLPQTVKYPSIGTNAHVDDLDEASVYNEDGSYATVTITDTVSYENLWTAEQPASLYEEGLLIKDGTVSDLRDGTVYEINEESTYLLVGTLMVKETGEPLLDSSGNVVTASAAFTADNEDGTIDIEFTLDLNDFLDEDGNCYLEGVTLVAYEVLYIGDAENDDLIVATHEDIDDEDQDIRFPSGQTHANDLTGSDVTDDHDDDEAAEEHEAYATTDVKIIDKISYENLHGGTEYTVSGTLYIKETGKKAKDDDGNVITSTVVCDEEGNVFSTDGTFTTDGEYEDEVDGYVYILFEFSGEVLAGKTVVAFETVSRDGQTVFTHADIDDDAQAVSFPKIRTSAVDGNTGTSTGTSGETTIVDTVTYKNLIPGQEYTMTGCLMDKATGEAFEDENGDPITAEVTFTADESGRGLRLSGIRAICQAVCPEEKQAVIILQAGTDFGQCL